MPEVQRPIKMKYVWRYMEISCRLCKMYEMIW
jgi:hypothetical protein